LYRPNAASALLAVLASLGVATGCQAPMAPLAEQAAGKVGRVTGGSARIGEGARYVTLDLPGVKLVEGQTILWGGAKLTVERGGVWLPASLQRPGEVSVSVGGAGTFRLDPTPILGRPAAGGAQSAEGGGQSDALKLQPIGAAGPEGATFFLLPASAAGLPAGARLMWGGVPLTVVDGGLWVPNQLLTGGGVGLGLPDGTTMRVLASAMSGTQTLMLEGADATGINAQVATTGGLIAGAEALLALGKLATGTTSGSALASTTGGQAVTLSELLTMPGAVLRTTQTGAWAVQREAATNLLAGGSSPTSSSGSGLLALLYGGGTANDSATSSGTGVESTGGSLGSTSNDSLVTTNGGSLVATNGGSLIATNGGSLVATNGGSLVATNGGSLVATNGGSLIAGNSASLVGYPYFPLTPPPARLQLLQLSPQVAPVERISATGVREYLWPRHTKVRAISAAGVALSDWVETSGTGAFSIDLEGSVPAVFFLQAEVRAPIPGAPVYRAYALASAPADGSPALVPVNANSTMTAGSTMHLLTYIPPENARLTSLISAYSTAVSSLSAENKLSTREAGDLSTYSASLDTATTRQGTLNLAWSAFLPPAYGSDLERADRAIRQADAETMSKAASLLGVYSPMYRLRAASAFVPGSFLAVEPQTAPLPDVDQSYLDPDKGGAEQAPPP
jgi:hypothetical protein